MARGSAIGRALPVIVDLFACVGEGKRVAEFAYLLCHICRQGRNDLFPRSAISVLEPWIPAKDAYHEDP